MNYPTDAGWTDSETGREAAQDIDATTLRGKCLTLLREKAMTPDECAQALASIGRASGPGSLNSS